MRYPTVLFDLDGTLVDSGSMILASFRHATRTVLAREIPDEELVAAVGGPPSTTRCASSTPAEAAFVGDSPFDVGAGKAAGVYSVGVTWGRLHSEERLRQAGADTIVHAPSELLDVL